MTTLAYIALYVIAVCIAILTIMAVVAVVFSVKILSELKKLSVKARHEFDAAVHEFKSARRGVKISKWFFKAVRFIGKL